MGYSLDEKMVIGVSSRALFDLTAENEILRERGWRPTAAIRWSMSRIS